MIPARLGSTRIKKKNLRLLNGIPLICYVVRAAKAADCFDEIYINSESEIFEQIAQEEGVKFFKRGAELATDLATNDAFTLDFFEKVPCDVMIQLLPTSPFITAEEIKDFTDHMLKKNVDTLISVKNDQIECVYKRKPINFDQKKASPPSQNLTPVQAYACVLMGWRKENYLNNMEKYRSGYHGGDGRIDFFDIKGFSELDIDNDEDFKLAEVVAKHLLLKTQEDPEYYEA
jgi:CMP-N-acetylneuraminic acid synthetase